MRDLGWDVQFVSWDTYKQAVIDGEGEMWKNFEDGDLVFGGMDFSCDFLYFPISYFYFKI
jgi:hypothetical protein